MKNERNSVSSVVNNSRDRVVSRTSPRMTPEQAAYGKVKPFQRTVLFDCLDSIFRTSGREPARRRRKRRNAIPIKIDREQEQEGKQLLHTLSDTLSYQLEQLFHFFLYFRRSVKLIIEPNESDRKFLAFRF